VTPCTAVMQKGNYYYYWSIAPSFLKAVKILWKSINEMFPVASDKPLRQSAIH